MFKGKTSFSYLGDIGLDDIELKEVSAGKTCDFWPTKAAPSNNLTPSLMLNALPKVSPTVKSIPLINNNNNGNYAFSSKYNIKDFVIQKKKHLSQFDGWHLKYYKSEPK